MMLLQKLGVSKKFSCQQQQLKHILSRDFRRLLEHTKKTLPGAPGEVFACTACKLCTEISDKVHLVKVWAQLWPSLVDNIYRHQLSAWPGFCNDIAIIHKITHLSWQKLCKVSAGGEGKPNLIVSGRYI